MCRVELSALCAHGTLWECEVALGRWKAEGSEHAPLDKFQAQYRVKYGKRAQNRLHYHTHDKRILNRSA